MHEKTLKSALEAIPAGQHGAVSVRGTPIEVPAFNWEIYNPWGYPTLKIVKDDGSFALVEVAMIDFFYTFPIPKHGAMKPKR